MARSSKEPGSGTADVTGVTVPLEKASFVPPKLSALNPESQSTPLIPGGPCNVILGPVVKVLGSKALSGLPNNRTNIVSPLLGISPWKYTPVNVLVGELVVVNSPTPPDQSVAVIVPHDVVLEGEAVKSKAVIWEVVKSIVN